MTRLNRYQSLVPGLLVAVGTCLLGGHALALSGAHQTGAHQTGDPLVDPERIGDGGTGPAGRGGSTVSPGGSVSPGGGTLGGAGATSPLDSGPGGGKSSGGGTGLPGGAGPSGGGAASIPATTGGFTLPQEAPTWQVWWEINRQRFNRERIEGGPRVALTGSADFFLGAGESTKTAAAVAQLPDDLLPSLLLAASDRDPRLASDALLALGQLSERFNAPDQRTSIRAVLRSRAAGGSRYVADSAVQALALGAHDGDLALLADLLLDGAAGRTFVASSEVSPQRRSLAAIGLGRLGQATTREDIRRLAAHYLIRGYHDAPRNRPEIATACLLAVAQIPMQNTGLRDPGGVPEPPSYSRVALLRFLIEQFDNRRRLNKIVEAHLPASMAIVFQGLPSDERQGLKDGLAEPLVKLIERPRRETDALVQTAALAAGALGDWDDDKVDEELRSALIELLAASDTTTRTMAMLALGMTLGTPGESDPGEGFEQASELLARLITRGSTNERPAAALALGTAGATLLRHGEQVPSRWMIAVRAGLSRASSSDERIALSLAAGLMGDRAAQDAVLNAFERAPAGRDRARIAEGLGLMRSREAVERLREELDRTLSSQVNTRRLAEAAALCGDTKLPDRLLASLNEKPSRIASMCLLDALAEVGGPPEVPALVELLGDETIGAGQRARAARALGRILGEERPAWMDVLAGQLVVPGGVPSIFDGLGGGVLEASL